LSDVFSQRIFPIEMEQTFNLFVVVFINNFLVFFWARQRGKHKQDWCRIGERQQSYIDFAPYVHLVFIFISFFLTCQLSANIIFITFSLFFFIIIFYALAAHRVWCVLLTRP
jgi:hypothetical protein